MSCYNFLSENNVVVCNCVSRFTGNDCMSCMPGHYLLNSSTVSTLRAGGLAGGVVPDKCIPCQCNDNTLSSPSECEDNTGTAI